MAIITGTLGDDIIAPTGVSAGVTGGVPGTGADTIIGTAGSDTLDGGGGSNLLGYASFSGAITASFAATVYAGAVAKPVGTDNFVNIRGVYGTAFADTLIGSTNTSGGLPYAIILRGGGGNDTINGQNSLLNLVDYTDATAGITADLGAGTASGAGVGTDTLVGVRRILGSAFDDTITGGAQQDMFVGSSGNDRYDGAGLGAFIDYSSTLTTQGITATAAAPNAGLFGYGNWSVAKAGTQGTDTATSVNTVWGTFGNDAFFGATPGVVYSWNTYQMRGGNGNDSYTGYFNGINRVDYGGLTAAVTVDLEAGTASKGVNGTDTLSGILSVRGTNFNDTLLGSSAADSFIIGSLGAHTIDGRAGADRYTYAGTGSIVADLQAGTVVKPNGITDTLISIANISGNDGNDTLYGDAGANTLWGFAGSNLLDGRGGEDWASIRSFFSTTPTQGGSIDLRYQTALNPFGGTDTLVSIEHASGSAFADTLTGLVRTDGLRSFLRGGGGNDTLQALDLAGNILRDTTITADYSDALTRVLVNLGVGTATDDGYFGGTDTLRGIQSVRGSAFGDVITGTARNDVIEGGLGDDIISGGAGRDIAILSGAKSANMITRVGASFAVTGPDGTDFFSGVETLRFADGEIQVGGFRPDDLTGRGFADILWREAGGSLYMFQQEGAAIVGQAGFGGLDNIWTLRGKGDFDANGVSDLLWRQADGTLYAWQLGAGGALIGQGTIANLSNAWSVSGVGDFNGDGRADIMFRNTDGTYYQWQMDGLAISGQGGGFVDPVWQITHVADFDGDGKSDLLWRNSATGDHYMFLMDGLAVAGQGGVANPGAGWDVAAVADLNGDAKADLVWRDAAGDTWGWLMDGSAMTSAAYITTLGPAWTIAQTADFTGDGKEDLLWRLDTGDTWLMAMDGTAIASVANVANVPTNWAIL